MSDDEVRKRLVNEMQSEKLRALARQKEEYEDKIKNLKSKRKNIFKKKIKLSSKQESELTELEKKAKVEKLRKRLIELRKRNLYYTKTRNFLRALRLRNLAKARQQIISRRINRIPVQAAAVPIGWESAPVARQLERELSFGNGGVTWDGANVANLLGKEVFMFSNNSTPSRVRNVNVEAALHARAIDINPSLALEKEVHYSSNLLF